MPDAAKVRVLIVDDDPGVRQFLAILFARGGASSALAEDGGAAIEILRRETFDVILLDLLMPRVDGLEVLQFMREENIATPVVVVSAVSDQMAGSIDRDLVRVTLQKPFDPTELLGVVQAVIAESKHGLGVNL